MEPLDACFVQPEDSGRVKADIDCGYIAVSENHDRPDDTLVRLGFIRINGRRLEGAPPLFMIAGRPGSSLINSTVFFMFDDSFLGPVLQDRDIVILDQRGAGHSLPRLDCPETDAFGWTAIEQTLDREASNDLVRQALPVCARRAATQGIDLSQYNVLSIVEDINAARLALGYDRIALYGASYGAQVGQQMLREFPDVLDAVILDGSSALSSRSWVQDRVRDVDDALTRLEALCEADGQVRGKLQCPRTRRSGHGDLR